MLAHHPLIPLGRLAGSQAPPNGTDPGPSHSNDSYIFNRVCMTHIQPSEAPESRCLPWSWPSAGVFRCGCCGHALFNASDTYDAGTGWPSFHNALPGGTCQPSSTGTEIVCAKCGAHLGDFLGKAHYCIDGVCLTPPNNPKFGNGCEPKRRRPRVAASDDVGVGAREKERKRWLRGRHIGAGSAPP